MNASPAIVISQAPQRSWLDSRRSTSAVETLAICVTSYGLRRRLLQLEAKHVRIGRTFAWVESVPWRTPSRSANTLPHPRDVASHPTHNQEGRPGMADTRRTQSPRAI